MWIVPEFHNLFIRLHYSSICWVAFLRRCYHNALEHRVKTLGSAQVPVRRASRCGFLGTCWCGMGFSKELCLRHIPSFPGCVANVYRCLMSAGLEGGAEVIDMVYHIITVASWAHHLSLFDGHYYTNNVSRKKSNAKSILLKLLKSTLLEISVLTLWLAWSCKWKSTSRHCISTVWG